MKTRKKESERKVSLGEGKRPRKGDPKDACAIFGTTISISRVGIFEPPRSRILYSGERKYFFSLTTPSIPQNATANRTPSSCDQRSCFLRSDASRRQTSRARVRRDRGNTAPPLAFLRLARRIAATSCPTSHSSISNSKGSTPRTFHRRQGSTPSTTTKKNFNTSVYLVKYPPRLRCIALSYRRSAVLQRFCPWKRRRKWICKTDGSDG